MLNDPQMLNSYSYARNNPINMYDPDGKLPTWFTNSVNQANNIAQAVMNVITSFTPFVSDYRDVVETMTGYDMITGTKLTEEQRSFTGFLAVTPLISGSAGRNIDDAMGGALSGVNRAGRQTLDEIRASIGNASGKTINGTTKIPDNWTVSPTQGVGGTMYTNPNNPAENIRLMPGNPAATHEVSQNPYWRHQVDGGYLDSSGKINQNRDATHLPINSLE